MTTDPVEAGWRGWLELEFEAVWTYPVLAARATSLRTLALEAHRQHLAARDRLLARFTDAGMSAPAPEAAYDIGSINSATNARDVAVALEQRIAAATVALVPLVEDADRDTAVDGLREAALEAMRWGAEPEPFPGLRT